MPLFRQASFHGGEAAPNLYSRTDIDTRRAAVRKLLNFIPTPTGAAMNRPGFQHIGAVKDPAAVTRLIPFSFSTAQGYLLEFGNLYVRVWQNGARVSDGAGGYVEVVTPYTTAQLPRLQFVQSGDTMTLTHPSHAPRELKRTSATAWALSSFSIVRAATAPNQPAFLVAPITVADATHGVKLWDWVCTAVVGDEESLPSVVRSSTCQLAPDREVIIGTSAVTGATLYYWYRGRYGILGYVGSSITPSFVDDGQVPNYSDRPPTQRDPFASSEHPAVATYFQQRLAFANQPSFPQRILTSQVGRLHNFDYSLPQKDDDAVDLTVASRQYEEIRGLVPLRHLVVLTANTEFVIDNGGLPLTPSRINLVPVSYNGSAWVPPLVVNDAILYVQAQQASVRELIYGGEQGWGGGDISLVANHLLAGANRSIREWAYQRLPYSVAWMVRDDGRLLSLTYAREFNVAAWAQHDTDGTFESVAVVPEGNEEAVYVIANRGSARRIERAATRHVADIQLGCFLDSSVYYNGVPATVFAGLTHLEGKAVTVLADGVVVTGHTVTGGSITLATAASVVHVGLPYNADIELLDLVVPEGEKYADEKIVSRVIWEVDRTSGLQAGETFSALAPWTPDVGYVAPALGLDNAKFVVPVIGSWNTGGRACLRQSSPLPVTVIGVTRDVTFGSN